MPINRNVLTLDQAIARYGPEILKNLKLVKSLPIGSGVKIVPPTVRDGLYSINPQNDPTTLLPLAEYDQPAAFVAATYQTIISYTVPTGKIAYIHEISITSNKPTTAQWQITINGEVLFTDKKVSGALNLNWPGGDGRGISLTAGMVVLIEAKSDGATSVTAEGLILGVEEG